MGMVVVMVMVMVVGVGVLGGRRVGGWGSEEVVHCLVRGLFGGGFD